MIWVKSKNATYQMVSFNVSEKGSKSELWGERVFGSTMKLVTGTSKEVKEHKDAIDYCIENGVTLYTI